MSTVTRRQVLKMMAAAGLAAAAGGRLIRTAVASDTYSSVVLAKGPVGYWRLGEAAGPAAFDSSPNGYAGTYNGSPSFGQPGAIVGDLDTAVGFNGLDSRDYVEIPDPANGDFSQPTSGLGLTVEVWMRPDALIFPGQTANPYVHWLGKGVAPQHEWAFRFYSQDTYRPNRISAYIWNPSGGEGAGAYFQDDLIVGEWIHIVACYEPGDANTDPPAGVQIYKNGVKRLGPPSSGTLYRNYNVFPVHGSAPLRLGTRDLGSFLTGGLDEVAIYPRVLDPLEIMDNYTTGIT
jgi:hypothetical protein